MFIVFDLETTGFNSKKDDIIQFAYAAFDKSRFLRAEVLYFYYEGMSWSEEAYGVHKIPLEFLAQYKDDFQKNLIRMFTVLGGANVCGFNSDTFDVPFAKEWLARMGLPGLEYRVTQDVMVAYRPITHRHQISLINLCNLMKISPDSIRSLAKTWFKDSAGTAAHDASYDVTATAIFTLQGVANGLIGFDDSFVAPIVETQKSTVPAEQLVAVDNDVKQRDPKGVLVYLGDTPYILNSDKERYVAENPLPYEVNSYIANKKLIKQPFTQSGAYEWIGTDSMGYKYTLYVEADKDTMWIDMPSKRIQAF